MDTVNIALIGDEFMGKAHSNAWSQVTKFFDPPVRPVLHTVCARGADKLARFAECWGWQNTSTNWHDVVTSADIDLVDIATPNDTHAEIALAALKAGKHVACEKPLANTFYAARQMRDAARKASGKTSTWLNYRRCPAVAYAYKLVEDGVLGDIIRVDAAYLQDWADNTVPLNLAIR